ncbi:MAG: nucleotidyltransferase domain-containing protein [Nitrospirales bacterium]
MNDASGRQQLLSDRQALRARIVECFRDLSPERIILFGSAARGQADQWSDVDLILVVPTEKRFLDRLEDAYLRWTLPFAADILVYTPAEFDAMVEQENSLISEALAHGVVLYERSGR